MEVVEGTTNSGGGSQASRAKIVLMSLFFREILQIIKLCSGGSGVSEGGVWGVAATPESDAQTYYFAKFLAKTA